MDWSWQEAVGVREGCTGAGRRLRESGRGELEMAGGWGRVIEAGRRLGESGRGKLELAGCWGSEGWVK